jgi:hypothetical protein
MLFVFEDEFDRVSTVRGAPFMLHSRSYNQMTSASLLRMPKIVTTQVVTTGVARANWCDQSPGPGVCGPTRPNEAGPEKLGSRDGACPVQTPLRD